MTKTVESGRQHWKDNVYNLNIEALHLKNRNRLIRTFLPDIEQARARLGYVYRVTPFNYNLEHFKTVEIRQRPARYTRPLHDSKVVMKVGHKAANEIEPRPLWAIKPLQFGKAFVNPNEEYTVFTRLYPWRFREVEKSRDRSINGRTHGVINSGGPMIKKYGDQSAFERIRNVRTS